MRHARLNCLLLALILAFAVARLPAQDYLGELAPPLMESDSIVGTYGLEEEFARTGKYPNSTYRGWGKTFGLAGGAEMTFLAPQLNGTAPRITTWDLAAPSQLDYSTGLADIDEFHPGSRVWLGVQAAQWGLVGRYWRFSNAAIYRDAAVDSLGADAFPAVLAESRLDAYALDFEVTRAWQLAQGRTEASLGVRFASLDHDAALHTQSSFNNDLLFGLAASLREYRGTGLTVGWSGQQPFFGSQQFRLFWNTRTSALWGTVRNTAESQALIHTPGGWLSDAEAQGAEVERPMFIGEIQLGLEWTHQLTCPAAVFARVAGEYQTWIVDGGDVLASASATDPGVAARGAVSRGPGIQAAFVGLSLGFGLHW